MRTFVIEEYDGVQLVERRVIEAESWDHLAERIMEFDSEGIPRVKPKPQPEDDDVFGVAV